MPRLRRSALAGTIFVLVALPALVQAQTAPGEKKKIEFLIEQVSRLKETKFIRNGSAYSAEKAATFLRRKWQANASAVKTASDFIDKVASFSGTSGKPYLIQMRDGTEVKSRDYLLAELEKLKKAMPEQRTNGG